MLPGRDNKILGLLLLQHQPLHLNIIFGVAPVAQGVQIAEKQAILQAELDARQRARNFSGNEGLATTRRLVIEEDSVAGVYAVCLSVVDRDPVGIQLGDRVGAARVERRGFLLRGFLHQPVEFGS